MLKRLIRVNDFLKKNPTPLKLKNIYDFGNPDYILNQSVYLYNELPIRLAHRTKELSSLPENIINSVHLQNVHDLYIDSFERILKHPKPKKMDDAYSFYNLIKDIKNIHGKAELNLSMAIEDFRIKNIIDYDIESKKIDKILSDFYMSRIGIRFLIGQHIAVIENKDNINNNNNIRGIIDKSCNPFKITKNAIDDIQSITNHIYLKDNINYNIIGDSNIKFMYVPEYLYYILFEIIKNSTQAIINLDSDDKQDINIHIIKGTADIIIKVSDNADGFSRELSDVVFSFLYTSSKDKLSDIINKNIVLSGYGYGLGLSRIFARYFDGDVKIISSEGIGTDTYIFLKILNANENILT
jgi:pyruvate dehydrogenase kinase 2/3/4